RHDADPVRRCRHGLPDRRSPRSVDPREPLSARHQGHHPHSRDPSRRRRGGAARGGQKDHLRHFVRSTLMRDIYSNIGPALALSPAVQAAAIQGPAIDLQGYDSVAFVVNTGAIVSVGDFGVKVQHSDTTVSGDFVDAPAGTFTTNAPATLA